MTNQAPKATAILGIFGSDIFNNPIRYYDVKTESGYAAFFKASEEIYRISCGEAIWDNSIGCIVAPRTDNRDSIIDSIQYCVSAAEHNPDNNPFRLIYVYDLNDPKQLLQLLRDALEITFEFNLMAKKYLAAREGNPKTLPHIPTINIHTRFNVSDSGLGPYMCDTQYWPFRSDLAMKNWLDSILEVAQDHSEYRISQTSHGLPMLPTGTSPVEPSI